MQARYGTTAAQISAVESWLKEAGLQVTEANGEVGGYVAVTGTLAAARKAFGVTFGAFEGPEHRLDRAPEETASAPEAVAGDVLSVEGLNSAKHYAKRYEDLPKNCRRLKPTTGSRGRPRATTAKRSRQTSRPPMGTISRGRTAATRRARSVAPTGSPRPA